MVAEFEIRSSQSLAALGRRLAVAGDGRLRRQLLTPIRTSVQEAIPAVRESARTTLPRRGGLADEVAGVAYGVRLSLAASGGRVSFVGRGMKEIRDIDGGNLRHPTFARFTSGGAVGRGKGEWHAQKVTPGFASKPLTKQVPKIRFKIELAMQRTAEEITRGGGA
jgi:hypothetical protein